MAKKKVNEPKVTNSQPMSETSLNEANTQPDGMSERAANIQQMVQMYQQQKEEAEMAPKKITNITVMEAAEVLRKYKAGKARLEQKIIANEEFWKLRQWNYHNDGSDEFKPATAWLWDCIQSRHSDIMDSYPTANFLPRQSDDKEEARMLSDIVPVILEQNQYEDTYDDVAWYLLKQGGCCQGVFWDGSKHNGLGDISIKKIDFLNLFWEPGVTDIQVSENVFTTELVSNKILEQRYPQTIGHLNGSKENIAKYLYDDNVSTDGKSVVIDWYYKTEYNGRKALQYVKFVNDVVLYATENDTTQPVSWQIDPQTGMQMPIPSGEPMAVRGLYDHAMYPFVVAPLYPIEGSLCGYGLTDIGRDTQMSIDILNKAVLDNAVSSATPRHFLKSDGSVNEEELLDINQKIIHVEGNIDGKILPVQTTQLPANAVVELQNKIEELKHITSSQEINNGGAPSGVTAASAIAALQETAGKNSRTTNKTIHRAYREVCYMVLELVRQFYDQPRQFRIAPDTMGEQFVTFSNEGIKASPQMLNGNQNGYRVPEFDIEVTSEKANPYKKMEQNELALNFYSQGFFNPQMADQAIACLQMMDFSQKEDIIQRIQANGTMYELLLQFEQIALSLAQEVNPALAEQIGQMVMQQNASPLIGATAQGINLDGAEEHPFVDRARNQARESTQTE